MKQIYILLSCIVLSMAMSGCQSQKVENVQTADTQSIPALKDRKGSLSTTEEWKKTKANVSTLFEKLKNDPKDFTSMLILAVTYMQEARITGEHPYYYPAAMTLVEQVIQGTQASNPIHFKAMVSKASILLSQHQFKEALQVGKAALLINDQQSEVYGVLCDANVELGNYDEAVAMADKMNGIKPDLRSYARISYLREIFGDNKGAVDAMALAVAAGLTGTEHKAWARVTLGKIYEKVGDLQHADNQYTTALKEYPDYGFAISGLARIAAAQKKYDKAIELCEKAESVMPEFSFTEDKAIYYQLKGDTAKGKEYGTSVVAMLKEDQDSGHETGLELANLYAKVLKNYDLALASVVKEHAKRPNNIDVCHTLAYIKYQTGHWVEAQKLIEVACRTNKQDPELLLLKGLIYAKNAQKNESKILIHKALALNPYMNDGLSAEARKL